jgi:hydroxybutyrate-dimer hydrolase
MPISKLTLPKKAITALTAALFVAGSVNASDTKSPYHETPERHVFDGRTDDLLTAGLGIAGLAQQPRTAETHKLGDWRERRQRAVHQNWRALVDLRRWPYGSDTRIAGIEYVAHVKASGSIPESSFLLQIPATFDANKPCLLLTAASGSRGIFGSLPTVGQWGLRKGCAVVSDDKGLGMRVTDPANGWRLNASGRMEQIAPSASPFPHALQMAHAHQAFDSEPNWGRMLLRSGELALQLLSAEYPQRPAFTPQNTLIIAAGISNGGAAVLQALETDDAHFIDAAVASEPNVHTPGAPSLYEYATLHAMLQPCAILAENLAEIPLGMVIGMNIARHTDWCERLAKDGLVNGTDSAARASEARQKLLQSGIEPVALRLGAVNLQFGLWTSVAATYAQSYLRRDLNQPACNIGFAATDTSGQPRALQASERAALFSDGTGIAPTGGINLVARDSSGGLSIANALAYDTAKCLRNLSASTKNATDKLNVAGRTGKRPVIVLHGASDALIPIAHTSRRYASLAAPLNPNFRFLEIANGQHFDAFLVIPGMEPSLAPMQPWVDRSLDDVHAFLTQGKALPTSGILR